MKDAFKIVLYVPSMQHCAVARQDFSAGGGSGLKKKINKNKKGKPKKKNDNKNYKKRYFSNILLHDIARTR